MHQIREVLCQDLVLPCVPVASTGAMQLAAGLFHHPAVREVHKLVQELHSTADQSTHVDECDGASGNDRLRYAVVGQLRCTTRSS